MQDPEEDQEASPELMQDLVEDQAVSPKLMQDPEEDQEASPELMQDLVEDQAVSPELMQDPEEDQAVSPELMQDQAVSPELMQDPSPEFPRMQEPKKYQAVAGELLDVPSVVLQAMFHQAGVGLTPVTLHKIQMNKLDIMKLAFFFKTENLYDMVHTFGFLDEEVQAIQLMLLHVIKSRDLNLITQRWKFDTSNMQTVTKLIYCMAPGLSKECLNILQTEQVDQMVLKIMKDSGKLELMLQGVGIYAADIAILSTLVY
jgi:hypothetical protein